MQNNSEQNPSPAAVIPAVADFICRHGKEAITQAPEDIQDMFNNLMDTPHGNSLEYRQRLLGTLILIRDFSEVLRPFSPQTLHQALAHL
jgi:hypothetical protein